MASFTPNQQEALNYKKHISLTANAGSGKTKVLTKRFLDIVMHEDISLRNIAAITFTKKAASELYNKIAQELDTEIENAGEQSAHRMKLEDLRKQLISAHICTIHSFCADLLREFPAEAGIDPGFLPLDEYLETELIAECGYAVFRDEKYAAEIKELGRVFNGTEQLLKVVMGLIRSREQLVTPAKNLYAIPELEPIQQNLLSVFTRSSEKVHQEFFERYITHLQLFIGIAKENGTKKGKELVPDVQHAVGVTRNTREISLRIKRAVQAATSILTKGGTILAAFIPTALQEDFAGDITAFLELHKLFGGVAAGFDGQGNIIAAPFELTAIYTAKVLKVYEAVLLLFTLKKKHKSALDFTDMLLKLREILQEKDVRYALAGRFKYIMVDEYQDTNELQYSIFMPLLDDLQNGNLFVVGDDKQSIYMFRNAEIEIFSKTTQDILHASNAGSELKLPDTFRMAPGLCLFINKIFERLFANPLPMFNEVAHVETVCARQSDAPGEIALLVGKKLEDVQVPEEELVIAKILELKHRLPDLKWGDIAILSRKKSVFETYRMELPKYNIPFIINGGRGFFSSQCVFDVMNYLRFLVSPDNDAPLLGILRSPFYLLSDAELLQIRFTGAGSFFNRLKYYTELHPENNRIAFAYNTLSRHTGLSSSRSISRTVQLIFDETHYMALMASRKDAPQQLANLAKLKSMARSFEQEGFRTLYDFSDYLYTSGIEADDESFASVADAQDAVQIMSIHASKGLQYKVVFLIRAADDLSKKGMNDSPVKIDKEFGLLFKLPDNGDYFKEKINPPHKAFAEYIQNRKNMAEEKRLLYVALTRAEEYLFIAGTLTKDEVTAKSFMGMISHVVKPSYDNGTFYLNGQIKKLKYESEEFTGLVEDIHFPVDNITVPEIIPLAGEAAAATRFIVDMAPLPVTGVKNTISASQFAVYHSCPMQYYLRYRVRYPDSIGALQPDDAKTAAADTEAEIVSIDAGLRGQLLHKLLEMNAPVDASLPETLEALYNKTHAAVSAFSPKAMEEIASTYRAFVAHSDYKSLAAYPDYKTEYTILLREPGYRLHGIIDRLIFAEDYISIVDYKSTAHPDKLDTEGKEAYRRQLLFYAYLVAKMHPGYTDIRAAIMFISSPGKKIEFRFSGSDIELFGRELQKMHTAVLGEHFPKNTSHCPRCRYSVRHYKCVVE
ncbi:MAG: UvrD-helicase domain-containing protein [Ignavibacteriales bacterium]|nr:UvrD-helicase domain-containing protein [Ignavibacteriales bacterium]